MRMMNEEKTRAGRPCHDWLVCAVLLLVVCGCQHYKAGAGSGASAKDEEVFNSPEQAVQRIAELQAKQDWSALARYYDLSGASEDVQTLRSGEYFQPSQRR